MRDFPLPRRRPIGYFVHHQGCGHATRCAALVSALPADRPATVFTARPDAIPALRPGDRIVRLPSLFEPTGREAQMPDMPTPETLHCAPLGWPGIRHAVARLTRWFMAADPALLVTDVSAEIAQLARIASVPHVCVLQHGDRADPGHQAAYDGAAGLLAPFHADLAQPDWTPGMRGRTHFAPGLGIAAGIRDRGAARARLGLPADRHVVLALSGGGGVGMAAAPLGVGARTWPDALWITLGPVARDWHATEPGNLVHRGWTDTVRDHMAAADVIVAACGNTATHEILAAARPWIVVPEWRYFDEQVHKAEALARAGAALHLPHLPSSAQAWRGALGGVRAAHDPERQRALLEPDAAAGAARWLDALACRLWSEPDRIPEGESR